jgi:hypothetical protein
MEPGSPYSDSIVNDPCKLSICRALAADPLMLAIILIVNLSGTGIGAVDGRFGRKRRCKIYRLPRRFPRPSARVRVGQGNA